MRTEVVLVTPQLAKEWLRHNKPDNRRQTKARIQYYAEEMKAGRWQLTSQGIAFNTLGQLTNGQHRLSAIVEANIPIQMSVTYDEPVSAYIELDTGAKRSLAERLNMDKREIAVYNVFRILVYSGDKTRLGAETARAMHGEFGVLFEAITKNDARTFSVAAIKGACLYEMISPPNRPYAINQYRALVSQDYDCMSSVTRSLSAWLARNPRTIGRASYVEYREVFCRSVIAFSKENENLKNIQLTEYKVEIIISTLRELVKRTLSTYVKPATNELDNYVKPVLQENTKLKETITRLAAENKQLIENAVYNFRELAKAD